ncbi:thiamine pyrophosphate-binding protein [Candidatus Pacearchaeota archaeon]|nr:thiamine pyrophosphate-binding protein [Candidatus Pacearchaeota archaeon]
MLKIKVADFVINYLASLGIKDVFEVYGAANGDLIDAFTRTSKTRYVSVMHEQAGGFAAEGYSKISGLAAAIATSGPGGQNFVTPIANCFYDSVPAIFLTGQVQSRFMRPTDEIRQAGFQETPITDIVKPITKYAVFVKNPQDIKFEIEKAAFLARNKRAGPVLLDLPIDVQKAEVDLESLVGFDTLPYQSAWDIHSIDEKINSLLRDLSKSERPVMLIGAGVRTANAIPEFLEVANLLGIPCFPTWNALDVVTSDFQYYGGRVGSYGGAGRNFGIQNSDLLVAVGSRVSGRITGSNVDAFAREAKRYLVDVDEAMLQRKFQPVPFEGIPSDAKLFFQRLKDQILSGKKKDFSSWMSRVREWKERYDPVLPEYYNEKEVVNPYVFVRALSEEMKSKDILVGDCGGNIVVASQAFETKAGQRFLTNNGNSPMGFSFAGAMGACLAASPDSNVVCTIGDGGFNMNIQELQTVRNYGIPLKTFIMNNHCYGITRQFQRTNFNGRMEACGPAGYNPPDFVKICKAYGIRTAEISKHEGMRERIREVLDAKEPVVCDVNMHDWDNYSPRVFGGAPIEDMQPFLPRSEFRENMIINPIDGWEDTSYKKKHLPQA